MRRIFSIFMISGILVAGLAGQGEANDIWRGGSVYSHFGLGLPYDYRSSFSDGMGVYGVSVHDIHLPSIANPALWSRAVFTNASGVFEINSFDSQIDGNQMSATQFQTGPFQMVLPIQRGRIGVSISVSPLTSSRYTTEIEQVLSAENNHSMEEIDYLVRNAGSGGINKIEAGIGVRITNSLSVGYAPSLLLGTIQRDQTVIFDHPNYRPVNMLESTSHYGFGNRFGIYYTRGNAFRNNDRAAFGATVSLPVNLVSERRLTSRVDRRDITINPPSDGDATFPLEASGGISYNLNPYLQVSADVIYQNWEEYTNFQGENEAFLKDRLKFGLGTQYIAARRDSRDFFSRFIYRLGASYDTGSLRLEDHNIETFTIHAGLGIPSRTNSSVNLNVEYGFRGTDSNSLISERIFAFKISFNLSELMFRQQRLQ